MDRQVLELLLSAVVDCETKIQGQDSVPKLGIWILHEEQLALEHFRVVWVLTIALLQYKNERNITYLYLKC